MNHFDRSKGLQVPQLVEGIILKFSQKNKIHSQLSGMNVSQMIKEISDKRKELI